MVRQVLGQHPLVRVQCSSHPLRWGRCGAQLPERGALHVDALQANLLQACGDARSGFVAASLQGDRAHEVAQHTVADLAHRVCDAAECRLDGAALRCHFGRHPLVRHELAALLPASKVRFDCAEVVLQVPELARQFLDAAGC
jgi:hypothetical protein